MVDKIQNPFDQVMEEKNNRGLLDFEGYSPIEMQLLLYDIFGENCPVQLIKLTDLEYQSIPILNQMKFLIELIDKKGTIKVNKQRIPSN